MPFNTLSYFIFLPVIFLVHYFSPDRLRWLVLLTASFIFYSALKAPHLIVVLLLVTTISYFAGICMDRSEDQKIRRYILWGGISANVLIFVILKYLPVFTANLDLLLNLISPNTKVHVSKVTVVVGVSYFIFQAISYLTDIYLYNERPERHYGHFALYMSFFPKLLQGPIERTAELIPQFKSSYLFNHDNVRYGAILFAIGLIKKTVIADRIETFIIPVISHVDSYSGATLLLSSYLYYLRLYFDFSGYTDMALGTARMFNISLTNNFNYPYLSVSIIDFWRRWHISLSKWLFGYIFNPMILFGRNIKGCILVSALATFTISGIWHGSSYNFILWGILNGITFYVTYVFYKKYMIEKYIKAHKLLKYLMIFITFNIVSLLFIFFNNSVSNSMFILKKIFSINYHIDNIAPFDNFINNMMLFALIMVGILLDLKLNAYYIVSLKIYLRWCCYILLLFIIVFFTCNQSPQFAYFVF